MATLQRAEITIQGTVQGVGFRRWTNDQALALGIVGEVWNDHDGSVKVIAEGAADVLATFTRACGVGPDRATVTDCHVEITQPTDEYLAFSIRSL